MIEARSSAPDADNEDFHRSTQILLRHGFVVQGLSQAGGSRPAPLCPAGDEKSRSPSPAGPSISDIGVAGGHPSNSVPRVHSGGAIPSRRVSWDLSFAGNGTGFPALPFTAKQPRETSSSQRTRQTATKKFQRRSTIAAINTAERVDLLQEEQGQQLLERQRQHSSTSCLETNQYPGKKDIEAVQRRPRKSSSRERKGCAETPLQRRRSSATTLRMSVYFDEILQQQQLKEKQTLQHPSETIVLMTKDNPRHRYNGYREDYFLGDVVKSSTHMIIEPTPKRAIRAVKSLQIHDFAWVKRSDGLYTYAILAYRSTSPIVDTSLPSPSSAAAVSGAEEEYMYFVVDDIGSTKMVPSSRWQSNVRLVRENHD